MNHSHQTIAEISALLTTPGIRVGYSEYTRIMRAPKDMHTYGIGLVCAEISRNERRLNIALQTIDDGSWVIHFPPDANNDQNFERLCDIMDSTNFDNWDAEMFSEWARILGGYADI